MVFEEREGKKSVLEDLMLKGACWTVIVINEHVTVKFVSEVASLTQ